MSSNAKGTVFISTVRFLKESFGEEGLQKVIARLAPDERQRMGAPILASAWYPVSLLLHIIQASRDEFGASVPDLCIKMGRASADYSLTTVYSMVFKVSSPQWIISRASAVFASYYDTGKMSVSENGKGSATLVITDFADPAPELCERIAGWCGRVLEHCGAHSVRIDHIQCRCRGGKTCQYKASWE